MENHSHEHWMKRCLELAAQGFGNVAPNPMVGCVIVHQDKIIGEGFHKEFGAAHAEVEAINSVTDPALLPSSTLYVSLEPCCHTGKTPPCTSLILEKKIKNVVIGCLDPNPLMNGKSVQLLKAAGLNVTSGVLEKECRILNKRFITSQEKARPYIILKWAHSADGFIDRKRSMAEVGNQERITCNESNTLAHRWRSEEQAIMVGTTTAMMDNPSLSVRHVKGKNPLRVVVDKELKIPQHYRIFDKSQKTFVFTGVEQSSENDIQFFKIDFSADIIGQIMKTLHKENISSIIVEGGRELMNSFIQSGTWDEARVFTAPQKLGSGIKGPVINTPSAQQERIGLDQLNYFYQA